MSSDYPNRFGHAVAGVGVSVLCVYFVLAPWIWPHLSRRWQLAVLTDTIVVVLGLGTYLSLSPHPSDPRPLLPPPSELSIPLLAKRLDIDLLYRPPSHLPFHHSRRLKLGDHPVPMPDVWPRRSRVDRSLEFSERLHVIEQSLLRLLQQGRTAGPPWLEDEQLQIGDLQSFIDHMVRAERGPPAIHATIPPSRQPDPSFDKELLEIIMSGPPPSTQPVQGPPPLIPFIYRRGPKARPRSSSPIFEVDLTTRLDTLPVTYPPPLNESEPHHPTRRPSHLPQPASDPKSSPPTGISHSEVRDRLDIPTVTAHGATPVPAGTRRPDTDLNRNHKVGKIRGNGSYGGEIVGVSLLNDLIIPF